MASMAQVLAKVIFFHKELGISAGFPFLSL